MDHFSKKLVLGRKRLSSLWLVLLLAACGGGGGGTNSGSGASAPSLTVKAVSVFDAAPLNGSPINVSVSDQTLQSFQGNTVAPTMVDEMKLTFKSGLSPSSVAPLKLTFGLSAPGYFPAVRSLVLISAASAVLTVPMLAAETDSQGRIKNAPASLVAAASEVRVVSGNPNLGGRVVTYQGTQFPGLAGPQSYSSGFRTEFPAGVKLGRAGASDFVPASDGIYSLLLATYSPYATESMVMFPSGMVNVGTIGSDGSRREIPRVRVEGYFSIHASERVTDHRLMFSTPASYTLDIPLESLDGATQSLRLVNDALPVYRFNESTATWVYETSGRVVEVNEGEAKAHFQFNSAKTGHFAVISEPQACGVELTLVRAAADKRLLNLTALSRGFVDGAEGVLGMSYVNSQFPSSAGAIYATLPGGAKVGEVVIPQSKVCPRQVTMNIS